MTLDSRCQKCGKPNRLVGIEPHHAHANLDIWTFECMQCGTTATQLQAASSPIGTARAAGAGRELMN